MLFYEKMRKMCDKKATKAFTLWEVLLALSVWSLFMLIFPQVLFIVKKAYKHEEVKPLDVFTEILFYVKKGACFKPTIGTKTSSFSLKSFSQKEIL